MKMEIDSEGFLHIYRKEKVDMDIRALCPFTSGNYGFTPCVYWCPHFEVTEGSNQNKAVIKICQDRILVGKLLEDRFEG